MTACPASFWKLVVARVTRGSELVTVCRQFPWFCSAWVTAVQDSCYFSSEPRICGRAYLSERCLLSACSRPPAGVWSALPGFVVASWDTEGDVPSPASPAALPQLLAPPARGRCPRAAAFLRVPSHNSPWAQRWLKLARARVTFCKRKHKCGPELLGRVELPPWPSCPLPKPLLGSASSSPQHLLCAHPAPCPLVGLAGGSGFHHPPARCLNTQPRGRRWGLPGDPPVETCRRDLCEDKSSGLGRCSRLPSVGSEFLS